MKQTLLTLILTVFTLFASAQQSPLWLRFSAISPDGKEIAFSYKGDLFTVPVTGGVANQLTSNEAYEAYPVWSPDSKKIAFVSTREGSFDIYIIARNGGAPKRLTTNSGNEIPITWKDNAHIIFQSSFMPTAKSILFAGNTFPQMYETDTLGCRPKLFSAINMEDLNINSNGDILYHDRKGYEDPFRKHHKSPITRDIWLYKNKSFSKLTSFEGENRNPVWASDNQSFYYLSEEDGTFNVWKRDLDGGNKVQLTHFNGNPVRYLSASKDGTLCFGYDGEIYTLRQGQKEPSKVTVSITKDKNDFDLKREILSRGATEMALSPNEKEIAFIAHGDVYVTSIDYKTTKQITDTPEQERSVTISPDGRHIAYASERNGMWNIYQTSIKNEKEKLFTYATELTEKQLTKSNKVALQPDYSPDGKSIAYIEDRGALKAIDLKSNKERTLMDGKYMYSYSDGDLWFEWSPDSKWLLSSYIGKGGWNNSDIALVSASGNGEIHNLTNSGYNDGNGKWVLNGKAMLFESDRAGYRSHGSWGAESDTYLMFFDLDAYELAKMNKEDRAIYDEQKKEEKKAKEPKTVDVTKKKEPEKKEDLKFDLANCKDRIIRLTVNSSHMGDAVLSPDGYTLYYQAAFEGGYDLWKRDLKENKTQVVMKDVGGGMLIPDKDFKNLYICNGNSIRRITLADNSIKNISFQAAFNYRPYQEREYLFNHVWQQVKDKFYVKDLHGVDWEGYKKTYAKFLPHINNNYDFKDMLSEMLGELNGSHTGARYYPDGPDLHTAVLGLFYDDDYPGNGLKVEEVINRGPFAVRNTGVTKGCIIEAIDGQRIIAGKDYFYMLDGKAGKRVRVSVFNPKSNKRFDVVVKPISKAWQDELLYRRWVDRNRALVDSVSGGKIAYVHVKAMDSQSFRTVFSELLSDSNRQKDAVIVDERHNGGGWLHDDLCTLLSGQKYNDFIAHGKYIGYDPWNKWIKPSCVLICADDYSNGNGFPAIYQNLKMGKLIGSPMAGTMTAVWWETLMDQTLVFGIPQVGCFAPNGKYFENQQLNPDITVYNSPEDYLNGHDTQLIRAVHEMMKK